MPRHMECVDHWYWLEREECPPRPSMGHGTGYNATVDYIGPGWYGQGAIRRSRHGDDLVWYERADRLANALENEMRFLASRLKTARRFLRKETR